MRLEREVLEISEGERRRIGQDLHDGLGQQLTAASMTTNALVGALENGRARAGRTRGGHRTAAARGHRRDALAFARSRTGRAPGRRADGRCSPARGGTSRSGAVRCVFECAQPVRVADAQIAGHLYRIAQEAVNNALKHAAPSGNPHRPRATRRRAGARGGRRRRRPAGNAPPPNDGIGLRVMRYRVRLIGGVLEIGSPPAGGTRICLPH